MSAFKKLSKSDIFLVPYIANKQWEITSGSNYYTLYEGQNITGSFSLNSSPTTSLGEYKQLVYSSINHLFYQNYSSSLLNTHSLASSLYYESASSYRPTSSYFIYNENSGLMKDYPIIANYSIKVLSFSKDVVGTKIKENTFRFYYNQEVTIDDGIGNLIDTSKNIPIGNIFYGHGLIVITDQAYQAGMFENAYTASFQSEHIIYEKVIRCNIKEHEMNCSYNPSLRQYRSSDSSSIHDFATGSLFQPYFTTIGFYNDNHDLLMVAKVAQPIPLSQFTDTNIIVKIDV